jgi:hypothetical protein
MAGMETAGAIHASEHFHFDKTKDGTDASARAPSRKAKDSEVLCTLQGWIISEARHGGIGVSGMPFAKSSKRHC